MRRGAAAAGAMAVALLLFSCSTPEVAAPGRPRVEVARAVLGAIDARLELSGRLVPPPELDATLAPQVAGRLTAVRVRAGEAVAAGQLLAEVEEGGLREEVSSAEAELARAESDERARAHTAEVTARLVERGIAAAEEREADAATAAAARAGRVAAEGRLAAARRSAGWARLVAPFAGVVVQLFRHGGETVDGTPATPVLRLAGVERTEVEARATAADLSRLAEGTAAEVQVADRRIPARLSRVARAVDPSSGLGEVRAVLAADSGVPLFADARLVVATARHAAAVLVPAASLRRSEAGRDEVVVIEGGTARPREVGVGLRDGDRVEILAGVAAGETVALAPLGLEDGTAVEVAAAPGPPAP